MRSLLLIALATACCAQDATPPAAAQTDEATRIAAEIIRSRARDAEASGQAALAAQLDLLAKGLTDSRVTLYDASLVMQIAATPKPAPAAPAAAPLSQEGKASVRRATSLLDGDPAPAPTSTATSTATSTNTTAPTATNASGPADAPAPASGPTPTPTTTQPVAQKPVITKVYAVDIGSSGKANVAAIGAGTKNGVTVGQRFTIKRSNMVVAICKVIRVSDALSYGEVVKGTLVDPNDDVKEGDIAVLLP